MSDQRRPPARVPATRSQPPASNRSTAPAPKNGVLVLSGYGLRIAVERGHLAVADGIGTERRSGLLPRATCGLRRLVVLGHAGTVSLEALRWLADVGAAFVQLDADGQVIAATGPAGSDDARIRRAQALATTNGVGLELARELLREKLTGQQALLDRLLHPPETIRAEVAQAAGAAGAGRRPSRRCGSPRRGRRPPTGRAWAPVAVRFATRDAGKVPAHWLTLRLPLLDRWPTGRGWPSTRPTRCSTTCYAILEAEARIACLTVGTGPRAWGCCTPTSGGGTRSPST